MSNDSEKERQQAYAKLRAEFLQGALVELRRIEAAPEGTPSIYALDRNENTRANVITAKHDPAREQRVEIRPVMPNSPMTIFTRPRVDYVKVESRLDGFGVRSLGRHCDRVRALVTKIEKTGRELQPWEGFNWPSIHASVVQHHDKVATQEKRNHEVREQRVQQAIAIRTAVEAAGYGGVRSTEEGGAYVRIDGLNAVTLRTSTSKLWTMRLDIPVTLENVGEVLGKVGELLGLANRTKKGSTP